MSKKTCCGCFALGCLTIIVAVVVGGYFGFDYLRDSGRDLAADGLKQTVEKIAEVAFDEADRNDINRAAGEMAENVRSGEVGLVDLFSKATQHLETGLYLKSMLLAFERVNLSQGEAVDGISAEDAGSDVVKRLIYGLNENKLSTAQIASISSMIMERYSESTGGEGEAKVTRSFRRLKTGLSVEELGRNLEMMKKICEENQLELPGPDFDAGKSVKEEFMRIFEELRKSISR